MSLKSSPSTLRTITGVEVLLNDPKLLSSLKGNIGLLCHSASVTSNWEWIIDPLMKKLGPGRITKLFGPQHGMLCTVQDNMIETKDFIHPHYKIPVYSLYSSTRSPTPKMLEGLDTFLVDLQDVGTRVYTYIWTLTLVMEAINQFTKSTGKSIEVVILDRPNPVGGLEIEGPLLKSPQFQSFVGRYPIPQRHGMTMGEFALWMKENFLPDSEVRVIKMENWRRHFYYSQTQLPWQNPSPNLPTFEGSVTFVGTVLFEGTNISEGRGTTRPLEIVGHPMIEPFSFLEEITPRIKDFPLAGLKLRPVMFHPMFQKHQGETCGGLQIHLERNTGPFNSWAMGEFLCREFYQKLGEHFQWKQPPYEYEYEKLPIDLINGTDEVRFWVEKQGSWEDLEKICQVGLAEYLGTRDKVLIYN